MKNKILPVGLKGNQINERMKELMGITPINENKKISTVELTKIGPDGNVYAIVRENHEYYIKTTTKKNNLVVEDFSYIGGLQNKKSEAYPSYAKAIKQLNLKFNSLNEAYGKTGQINVFEDDNLIKEDMCSECGSNYGMMDEKEYSDNASDFISKEISHLIKDKGYSQDRAVAAALSIAREKGYKVPEKSDEGMAYEMDTNDGSYVDRSVPEEYEMEEMEYSVEDMLREKELSDKQKAIAKLAGDPDEIGADDLAALRAGKDVDETDYLTKEMAAVQAMMDEEDEMTDKEREFAKLAPPHDKITYADKIAGARKSEGKLSIERAVDAIDEIIDTVMESIKKKSLDNKLDEVKYKLKLGADSAPASTEEPADIPPVDEPTNDIDFSTDDSGTEDTTTDMGDDTQDTSSSDKPFDDKPFDAGVEADEEEDPKKFIQQLAGKLGQSLRKYNEEQGEPDFELEKFAVNSVLSATHTSEMDSQDQKDIIKKVKTSGKGDEDVDTSEEPSDETQDDSENMFETEMLDEMSLSDWKAVALIKAYDEGTQEIKDAIFKKITLEEPFKVEDDEDAELNRKKFLMDLRDDYDNEHLTMSIKELQEDGIEINVDGINENSMFLKNPPKNNMFQEGSNDILDEKDDRCTRIAKRKYDVWPSAYASGAVVKCRQGKIWKNISEKELDKLDMLEEKWSKKYKDSIDCNNPKGFSQKAHCQGKKKHG